MAKRRKQKPKTKQPVRVRQKEAIVLIPLTYNDGTRVSRATLESIRDDLFLAFAGWTIEGTVTGAYLMHQTGRRRVEKLQKGSVVLEASQISELEEMVARWGAMLGQEAMLLKISDFAVKFIS